jgi:hypothetical protein
VQSNVAAASARVLVHCSVCFLLTTMVALGDAALVAGLHAGAGLPLSVSFGIAVGANLALVLLLFVVLLLVRCLNQSSDRAMSQALTGPQVGALCCIFFVCHLPVICAWGRCEQSGVSSCWCVSQTLLIGYESSTHRSAGAPGAQQHCQQSLPTLLLFSCYVIGTAAGCSSRHVHCEVHEACCAWQLRALH